LCILLPS